MKRFVFGLLAVILSMLTVQQNAAAQQAVVVEQTANSTISPLALWHGFIGGNLETYVGISNDYGARSWPSNTARFEWSVETSRGDEIPFRQNSPTSITVTFPRFGIYQIYCSYYSSTGEYLGYNWGEILVY